MLGRGRGGEGMAGERFKLTRIADALATMCPILRLLKKAARLEWTACGGVCVCVFITGEGESQNKEKQIWSYEERR